MHEEIFWSLMCEAIFSGSKSKIYVNFLHLWVNYLNFFSFGVNHRKFPSLRGRLPYIFFNLGLSTHHFLLNFGVDLRNFLSFEIN